MKAAGHFDIPLRSCSSVIPNPTILSTYTVYTTSLPKGFISFAPILKDFQSTHRPTPPARDGSHTLLIEIYLFS